MKMNKIELLEKLSCFNGTTCYYKHTLGIKYTEGVQFLAENAECYWLLDIVASYQFDDKFKKEEFQVFKLKVNPDDSAILEISDGDNNILHIQDIEFTDFPLQEITLWCIEKVCLLPSEY